MKTLEEKKNAVLDAMDKINIHEVTILTGDNASGKSLLRKLLWSRLLEQLPDRDPKKLIIDMSMERRTGSYASLGALSGMFRDNDVTATSCNSIHFIKMITNYQNEKEKDKRYLVFDEPEVGCGEEVQLGLALWINKMREYIVTNTLGLLIITHSRHIVKNVNCDNFINIEGKTKDEWLNREIVPKDPEELYKEADEFFLYLRDCLKSSKV